MTGRPGVRVTSTDLRSPTHLRRGTVWITGIPRLRTAFFADAVLVLRPPKPQNKTDEVQIFMRKPRAAQQMRSIADGLDELVQQTRRYREENGITAPEG